MDINTEEASGASEEKPSSQ